ncbi:MAG: lectin like domain-containing protein [Synergistaceae bacterium]|jgi:C1A family cysteine protease|nr:lectin like domain-containing protein [Synergistaceae bacterium]
MISCDSKNAVKFFAALSALVLSLASAPAGAAVWNAPVSSRYVEWLKSGREGYAPSQIDWSFARGRSPAVRGRGVPDLPVSYDLAAEGRVTRVEDQRNWGTCWSFATIKAIESSILNDLVLNPERKAYDLSELHLAYFAYSFEEPGNPGFTRLINDPSTQNAIFDNGGFNNTSIALLSRGTGPVYDSDAPYPSALDGADGYTWANYLPPAPYARARFRLKEALFLYEAEEMKEALLDIGALAVRFFADNDYLSGGFNFYYPDDEVIDHSVTLVGWDDNYPKENFRTSDGRVPPRDGAWRIQNSWGENEGDNGYYWISYEDTSFCSDEGAMAFKMAPADSFDGIYFHDPLGMSGVLDTDISELRMSNAFSAARDEKIVSVGFFTANIDIGYEIQIYRNIPNGGDPGAGVPALSAPQRGRAGAMGYYSVTLDEPVQLRNGERFAVEVNLIAEEGTYPNTVKVPVETMIYGTSDNASVAPGESYWYGDGEWHDTYNDLLSAEDEDSYSERNFNFNVKAFTLASAAGGSGSGCGSGVFGLAALFAIMAVLFKASRGKRARGKISA